MIKRFNMLDFFTSDSFCNYLERRIRSSFKNLDSDKINISFSSGSDLYVKRPVSKFNKSGRQKAESYIVLGLGAFDFKSILDSNEGGNFSLDQWNLSLNKFVTRLIFALFHETSHIAYTPMSDEIKKLVMKKRMAKNNKEALSTNLFHAIHNIVEDECINRELRKTYPGSIRNGYKLLVDYLIKEPDIKELKNKSLTEKFSAALIFNFLYEKKVRPEDFILDDEEFLKLTKDSLKKLEELRQYGFSKEGQEARVLMAYDLFMGLFNHIKKKEGINHDLSQQELAFNPGANLDFLDKANGQILSIKDLEAFEAFKHESSFDTTMLDPIQKNLQLKSEAELLDQKWDSFESLLSNNSRSFNIELRTEDFDEINPLTRELLEKYIYEEKGSFNAFADQRGKALASKIKELILESNGGVRDHQEKGRLSRKHLHKASFTKNIFYQRKGEKQLKDIRITALLDLSGSMHSSEGELKDASVILSRVGMDLKIPMRILGYRDMLQVLKDYGPISQREHKEIPLNVYTNGGTDLPDCLNEALGLSSNKGKHELYIIVCDNDIRKDALKKVIESSGSKNDFALVYYSKTPNRYLDQVMGDYRSVVGPKMAHLANKDIDGDLERVILEIVKEHIFI